MVITAFQILNKLDCFRFFQKIFLLVNISIEVVLSMFFLIFSNANIQFAKKELTWKIYITKEALSTTRQVEFINQKKFAKAALDKNIKDFAIYISFFGLRIIIYPVKKAQKALLLAKKITVLAEYFDFANVFLEESANVLPEQIGVNEHAIKLEKGKEPLYGSIYSLEPVELKTLKTYIKTNLANGFI